MNRLFIVGNGFDLAHGLPTSYSDFLKYCWQNIGKSKFAYINPLVHINFIKLDKVFSYNDFKEALLIASNNRSDINPRPDIFILSISDRNYGDLFRFENDFFRILNQLDDCAGWVDIEDLYYKILKSLIKNGKGILNYRKNIYELNKEFEEVKEEFEKYLYLEVILEHDFQEFEILNHKNTMCDILRRISVFNNENNIKREFLNDDDVSSLKSAFEFESRIDSESNRSQAYFLSFNYTPTLESYIKMLNGEEKNFYSINYIHGQINNINNPINFGFGDEMDEDYKAIENENENEYITNFKSFQYSQNSNYKNFLRLINSDKFQVCILGHSCGLSDRVLLNTIFEHPNCRSIKVYYYQNGDTDNYKDIIQNISRHFDDKTLMRELLVEKSLSSPLPQKARFQNKS